MIKKMLTLLIILSASIISYATTYVDVYDVKIIVSIPRVYDNTTSQGYRSYQRQKIQGTMYLTYDSSDSPAEIQYGSFTNLTHKTSLGKNITYQVFNNDDIIQRLSVVGNNKTMTFSRGTCCLNAIFEPSYSVSDVVNEDNSLYVQMTSINGRFSIKNGRKYLRSMSGRITGSVGCACSDYGHISPTRMLGYLGPLLHNVIDVAACEGIWRMRYRYTMTLNN